MTAISSDVICDLGELKIRELCRAGSLDVAQPIPDRTGKDLIVEWPPSLPTGGMSLDTRPAPLSCIIQVKSIKADKSRIAISLSAAERLARDLRPAFIVVARVDQNRIVRDIHVIHLRGALIGHLLKRLRQATKEGKAPNELTMSISIHAGTSIPLVGNNVRAHLEAAIGVSMAGYADAKQNELESFGFDSRRILVNIKFTGHSHEEIVDGFLGDQKLNASSVQFSERRFNIELPGMSKFPDAPNGMRAVVSLRTSPVPCELVVRNAVDAETLSLKAELQSAGLPGTGVIKIRARTPSFDVIVTECGVEFLHRECANSVVLPLSVWADTFRFWRMISDRDAHLALVPNDDRPHLPINVQVAADAKKLANLRARESYFAALLEIVRAAGCPEPLGRYEEFARLDGEFVRYAVVTLRDSDELDGLGFTTTSLELPDDVSGAPVILLSLLQLGDQRIAIAQKSVFDIERRDDGHQWRSRQIKYLCVKHIVGDVDKAYADFGIEVQRVSGISTVIDPGLFADPQIDGAAA